MLHVISSRQSFRWWAATAAIALVLTASATKASEERRTAQVRAVARAQGSVVNIRGEKTSSTADTADRSLPAPDAGRRVNGMGSGIVIDPRGYVLTNFHVVDGVRKISATLCDGQSYTARVVAQDEGGDLAIIKIDGAADLPVIDIGTSSDLMLAEPVIAVGNPYGYEHTVTRGIISQLRRTVQVTDTLVYEDLIQTDTSINPGNSGGPLLNADGRCIGIVVAVRAGAQGIAFAIPIDKAMESAAVMLADRQVRVWHGAAFKDDTSDGDAPRLVVKGIEEASPADLTGLVAGDVVTTIGGQKVCRRLDVERALIGRKPSEELAVTVRRGSKPHELKLRLGEPTVKENPLADDTVWQTLGLRLEPVSAEVFKKYNTRYRGGLRVREVRLGSPAQSQGIRRGDVLLGMHVWETVSVDNVVYILHRPDFDEFNPLKFYILRNQETLFGHMRVSTSGGR
jgi:serine protease Do